ncbi:hypothetical protein QAD02_007092 [Eretmocerus hayati]|uniref:Uncharacterized protein n=1 Tax=Eretmocerus hayati TaxID=131215 RepID=A0ACC2N716_9HYME|nr:hypothetical protein QAD02_007092 [Eretmocerus hayati]
MRQNESVHQFCDTFDVLIRDHEMCGTKPLDESDKKAMFYQAVSDNSRDVRISEVIINALNKDMTGSEMKNIMLQFEASDRSRSNSDVRANSAQTDKRCHRCVRQGHLWASCPLAASGLWYCYFCKDDVPHNGNDPNCPSRNNPRDGYVPANLNQTRIKMENSRFGIKLVRVEAALEAKVIEPEIQKQRGRPQKRKNDEKSPLEADAKQRKNPERQAKTNRPTWSHLRRTEVETPLVDVSQGIERIYPKTHQPSEAEDELVYIFLARMNRYPTSFKEATCSDKSESWKSAVKVELDCMDKNQICQATKWSKTTIMRNTLEMTGMKRKQRRSKKQQP